MAINPRANHTGITVSDIDAALRFWRDIMNCEVTEKARRSGPLFEQVTGVPGAEIDIAYVKLPGHLVELLQYVNPVAEASGLKPNNPGFIHLCLDVDDMDAAVDAFRRGGFTPVGPVQTVQDGPRRGGKAIYTRSEDGVVVELMQPPPAGRR